MKTFKQFKIELNEEKIEQLDESITILAGDPNDMVKSLKSDGVPAKKVSNNEVSIDKKYAIDVIRWLAHKERINHDLIKYNHPELVKAIKTITITAIDPFADPDNMVKSLESFGVPAKKIGPTKVSIDKKYAAMTIRWMVRKGRISYRDIKNDYPELIIAAM